MKKLLRGMINACRPYYDCVRAYHFGLTRLKRVKCNICEWKGRKFLDYYGDFGHIYRDAECPSCKSHPRHRYISMYIKMLMDNDRPLKLLHFAPEISLSNLFKSYNNINYLSVDIDPSRAMQEETISNLSFVSGSFDVVICIHVLEHIPDDKKAISELYRVLADDGFAILDVPIDYNRAITLEDSSIKTPEERAKTYWQSDHVRLYGRDFSQRLENVGFKVKVDEYISSLNDEIIRYHGLEKNPIYFCTK